MTRVTFLAHRSTFRC